MSQRLTIDIKRIFVLHRRNHQDQVSIELVSKPYLPKEFSLEFRCAAGEAEKILLNLGPGLVADEVLDTSKSAEAKFSRED